MPANIENSAVATELEKVSFHSNLKERQCQRMLKLPHNCTHLTCQQSNAQNSPSQPHYMNCELPDVQAVFRKDTGARDQIANIHGSLKRQESSRKTSSALQNTQKPSTVWITTNCGKFLKREGDQNTWPASWEICMQVRKQQLYLDMEQQTGSK